MSHLVDIKQHNYYDLYYDLYLNAQLSTNTAQIVRDIVPRNVHYKEFESRANREDVGVRGATSGEAWVCHNQTEQSFNTDK